MLIWIPRSGRVEFVVVGLFGIGVDPSTILSLFVSYRVHPPASFPSFAVPSVAPISVLFVNPCAIILISLFVRFVLFAILFILSYGILKFGYHLVGFVDVAFFSGGSVMMDDDVIDIDLV